MASSLQDQLLKTGLADSKKARKLAKEKRKEANLAKHAGEEFVDENKLAARQALAEKVQRDRELNEALNSKAQRKAINAQIKQLVEVNKLEKGRGDVAFNFTDGKNVKSLYVTTLEQKQLSAGVLSIVKQGDQYEILPRPVADKIAERDQSRVISCQENTDIELTEEEQGWYKDYEIPDDLMW
jgi:uncharacterized protein YaiL (DUF2058 family)